MNKSARTLALAALPVVALDPSATYRRKLISTPDAAATVAWYGKRFTYPAYLGFTTLAMSYFRRLMVREYPSESGRG